MRMYKRSTTPKATTCGDLKTTIHSAAPTEHRPQLHVPKRTLTSPPPSQLVSSLSPSDSFHFLTIPQPRGLSIRQPSSLASLAYTPFQFSLARRGGSSHCFLSISLIDLSCLFVLFCCCLCFSLGYLPLRRNMGAWLGGGFGWWKGTRGMDSYGDREEWSELNEI